VVGPSPRSGEAEAPPRSRLSPGSGVGRGGDRRPRSRLGPSPGGRARRSPSSEVEVESEPWGRARRSFLWRLRPVLAAVSLTLTGGIAVGAAQAALFSCQVSQWRGEVTAVTSALSTEERASG
jgi:hypothetical protein